MVVPPDPASPSSSWAAKLPQLLGLWGLALVISAALAAAGQRWPDPLPIRGDLILVVLLAPPLAVLAWLLMHWSLAPASLDTPSVQEPAGGGGESDGIE
ncbi:MAG: hypothetical protein ACK5N0_04470 [Synechococcaceae cyanobacterium]